MTEQELRALVRDVIARQGGKQGAGRAPESPVRLHASHSVFPLSAGADDDGVCIIEPAVACNHCGFCKSLGH